MAAKKKAKKKAPKKAAKKATKKTAPKKATKKATKKTAKKATKKAPKKAAKKGGKKSKLAELIISKSRTKNAVDSCNVSGDFYGALDSFVREAINSAEARATANGRKTLRPQDL